MVSIADDSQAVSSTLEPGRQHIVDLEKQIRDLIEKLPSITSRPCIFKIPQSFREVNPKAHTPIRVAIGPYHADAEQLKSMELHKLSYLESLMLRSRDPSKLKDYIVEIEKTESKAWECYSGAGFQDLRCELEPQNFKKMLLLDGAFLVEFFCRLVEADEYERHDWDFILSSSDSEQYVRDPLNRHPIMLEIRRDLILIENKLPYFILEALFDCTFSIENPSKTFAELAYFCLKDFIPIRSNLSPEEVKKRLSQEVMHLVDLMRMCCLPLPDVRSEDPSNTPCSRSTKCCCCGLGPGIPNSCICLIKKLQTVSSLQGLGEKKNQHQGYPIFRNSFSVTELHGVGIRFEREKSKFINYKFDEARGVFEIPYLILDDFTETFFRNVMAFEQYHCDKFPFSNYISLMEGLIDTVKDVDILEERQVIEVFLESNEDIVSLFNTITKHTSIDETDKKFTGTFKKLTAYVDKPWNKWKAILHRDYFGSPWTTISVIAAVVLLALTVVQTIAALIWHD